MKIFSKVIGLGAATMFLASTMAFALGSHDQLQENKKRHATTTLTLNVTSASPAVYKGLGAANDMGNRNFNNPMGSLVSGGPESFMGSKALTLKFDNKNGGTFQNQQLNGGAIQQEVHLMVGSGTNKKICNIEIQENFHHEKGNHKGQIPITTVGDGCGTVKITAGQQTDNSAVWNVSLS